MTPSRATLESLARFCTEHSLDLWHPGFDPFPNEAATALAQQILYSWIALCETDQGMLGQCGPLGVSWQQIWVVPGITCLPFPSFWFCAHVRI